MDAIGSAGDIGCRFGELADGTREREPDCEPVGPCARMAPNSSMTNEERASAALLEDDEDMSTSGSAVEAAGVWCVSTDGVGCGGMSGICAYRDVGGGEEAKGSDKG